MYAWDITNILVGDNTSNEKIWENGEKSTIAAAILCVVVDNAKRPEYQNLTNVYWFVAEMCKAVGNKTPMQEYVKKLKPGHPAQSVVIHFGCCTKPYQRKFLYFCTYHAPVIYIEGSLFHYQPQ